MIFIKHNSKNTVTMNRRVKIIISAIPLTAWAIFMISAPGQIKSGKEPLLLLVMAICCVILVFTVILTDNVRKP